MTKTIQREILIPQPREQVWRAMWSACGPVDDTRVSFRLEPDGDGTRVFFEHSGFDVSQAWGEQAFRGAEVDWAKMLKQLSAVVAGLACRTQ